MNIFVLDQSPHTSAAYMCDKHVVKMILESCQLLSTAHRVLDGTKIITNKNNRKYTTYKLNNNFLDKFLYKSTMVNHPCSIWCRETDSNYVWLASHTVSLLEEYTQRYGKYHASSSLAEWLFYNTPENIDKGDNTPFALAMPEEYKCTCAIESYRKYYIKDKSKFAKWKNNKVPQWFIEGVKNNVKISS